jgi:YjbE family integral membrane protein
MDFLSPGFLSALAAIVVIDLVLAGDNAIVIALASRRLPPAARRRAILWGTVGAVAVRTLLTLVVVALLRIPGLLAIGGLLLVVIAYKLLIQPDDTGAAKHDVVAAGSFWAAIKTIVVADALMGLDNVLAVAGAAHGSFLLVVIGLLVSIPIVVWGSQLVLRLVERFPAVVYLGAGILAWTAVKMVASEPLLAGTLASVPFAEPAISVAIVGGVLSAGFMSNYRPVRARIAAHLADPAAPLRVSGPAQEPQRDGATAAKPLVPVDGSPSGLEALVSVLGRRDERNALEVHVLYVAPAVRSIGYLVAQCRGRSPRESASRALASAQGLLRDAEVACVAHVEPGPRVEAIGRVAQRIGATEIVIGTARPHSVTRVIEDGVSNRLIGTVPVPVSIVPGRSVPMLERVGLPVGAAAVASLLFLAAG